MGVVIRQSRLTLITHFTPNMRLLLAAVAVASVALTSVAGISTNDHDKVVGCYFGAWAFYRPGTGKFDIPAIAPMATTAFPTWTTTLGRWCLTILGTISLPTTVSRAIVTSTVTESSQPWQRIILTLNPSCLWVGGTPDPHGLATWQLIQ